LTKEDEMAKLPPLEKAARAKLGKGKIVQKGPDGIVYGENFTGRALPSEASGLTDQRAPTTTRALGRGRVAGQ
jgi:hypothetical protein